MKNIEIAYQQHGDFASGQSPLVLIHGLFGSGDNLSVIRRHFEQDYPVLTIDLPDHGKSGRSETFSFAQYTASIVALLNSLSLTSVHLIGHSLGGKVSMLIALEHPALVSSLVVMDIAPTSYTPRHHNVIKGLTSVDLANVSGRKDAMAILNKHIVDAGTQAFLLKSLYQNEQGQWDWRFNLELLVRDYPILSAWEDTTLSYQGPTLFLKGADSDYILAEHQESIASLFPNANAKILPAGHWLHAQKPQMVNTLITRFLQGK